MALSLLAGLDLGAGRRAVHAAGAAPAAAAGETQPALSGAGPESERARKRKTYLPLAVNTSNSFYVSTGGSDKKGNGSASRPWKTIETALKRAPDGATILVKPGTYHGRVDLDRRFKQGVTVRSEVPYAARLRNKKDKVVSVCKGAGITLSGFDIAHEKGASGRYVVQIHGCDKNRPTERITLHNNIIHDSYYDDLLKVNNGARQILVEGNLFYNMGGPETDNHIDVNSVSDVTIQDNIFFNCFEGSGRANRNRTGHFIIIKDSNKNSDGLEGSRDIRVRRNIFLNWQGEAGSAFIGIGDGRKLNYHQARDVLIENNLMLGNSRFKIHTPLKVTGGKNITFRNNTVQGDLPSHSYAMRLMPGSTGLKNVNIRFYNNIWSDPAGTMGAEPGSESLRFSNTPRSATASFNLANNLYWNGGRAIPEDSQHLINASKDRRRVVANPKLNGAQKGVVPPCWSASRGRFDDGSTTIRQAFTRLAQEYARLGAGSPAINAADGKNAPADDILGRPRPAGAADIGAYEAP